MVLRLEKLHEGREIVQAQLDNFLFDMETIFFNVFLCFPLDETLYMFAIC